jgi:hypothetical protein
MAPERKVIVKEAVGTIVGLAVLVAAIFGVHAIGTAGCHNGWDAYNGRQCVASFWSWHDVPDGLPDDGTWYPQ